MAREAVTIVTIPATGAVGIVADEAAQELPDGAWSEGENVRFEHGYATRFAGHLAALTNPAAAAYHSNVFRCATDDYWVHATLTAAFADNGTTQTNITGSAFTGDADDIFTSCVLGGVFYLNNQIDAPGDWGGAVADNLAALPDWDSTWRCKALRSFKANILALNVTKGASKYTSMVKWSDSTEPGAVPLSWDHTDPTGDARELDLAESSDSVIDGAALGDIFIVYKDRSMYGLQATGGVDVFRYFRLPGDSGMLSQNCVANYPGGHVVLTPSDVITHNGTGPQSILDGRMRRWLFSRIDATNFRRSFVAHNPGRSETWICFPENGETACTKALVWNYKSNTFGVRDLPNITAAGFGPISTTASNTWDADTAVWDDDTTTWDQIDISQADQRLVCSSTDSRMYLMDQTTSYDGTAFETRITRTGMAFGDPASVKLIRALYPRIEGNAGTVLSIQLGAAMDAERAPAWSPAVSYTVGSSYKADTFACGRFISLRITGSSASWRVKSVDADVILKGTY